MIERLTPEQESRFGEFVEKWTAVGLSTEPADRPAAEAAIIDSYRIAGLNPPRRIVWCGSPLSQSLTRAIILDRQLRDSVGASVRDSVWASVGDSVRASVRASVRDSVWASVGASVRDSVWASVGASVGAPVRDSVWASVRASVRASVGASVWASVWDSVRDSVRASVRDSVWASVRASVRDSVWASVWASVWDTVYGQHDASWLAFYDFFRGAVGLTAQTDRLVGLFALARSAGWALPHEHICWVSERHHILELDERGRLHSLTGPAVMYPDGWAIYAVHGVRVPREVVEEPHTLTVQRIRDESNVEVRRVMMERFGLERYLHESGARVIDEIHGDAVEIAGGWDGLPVPVGLRGARLIRADVPDDEPLVMVALKNSTPEPDGTIKEYLLRVPPDVRTVREAVAWTFDVPTSEYTPLVET